MTKYEFLKKEICKKIDEQEWKVNQVIPSENKLCEEYGVSRITVRRAIEDLVQDGRLYRIKGKGCFVMESKENKLSQIYSYTDAILLQGKTPSKKQLSLIKREAGKEYAGKLGISEEAMVYVLESLYFADGVPYCLNISVMPEELFPRLEFFDFNNNSLYEILESFYQLNSTRVHQEIIATIGDDRINELLNNSRENPVLQIDAEARCLYQSNERVFELYRSFLITDILKYEIEKFNL